MDPPTVAAHSLRLRDIDVLAIGHTIENVRGSSAFNLRHQHTYVFADGFLWCVAVQLLRASIPAGNRSVQRPADDGILRRFDDRRESVAIRLNRVALGDVAHERLEPKDLLTIADEAD